MSDEPQDQQPDDADEVFVSVDDRAAREVAEVWGAHNLVDEDGNRSLLLIADLIEPTITAAVVKVPGDRTKVGVTATKLMEDYFSEVPGPAEWADYGSKGSKEYQFHEKVYKTIKAEVYRALNVQPSGIIQQRLANGNGGLVLCRMSAKGGREEMAYITRNVKCINEDLTDPELGRAKTAINRAAALSAMAMQRVPEHKKIFASRYQAQMKLGIDSGDTQIQGVLEAETDSTQSDGTTSE